MNFVMENDPYYRLIHSGKSALNLNELLDIITARQKDNRRLIEHVQGDLNEISRLCIEELQEIGYTNISAARLIATVELGRRIRQQENRIMQKISSSRDAYEVIVTYLRDLNYEAFYIILLNRKNALLRIIQVSDGGISGTVADPKRIFNSAIIAKASSIILAHNHPSGNTQPSEADIALTKKMKEAGFLLDLPVLDHLIIAGDGYYSFADEGHL